MPEQFGEKRHEATQHRRQQAASRVKLRSQDLSSSLLLLIAILLMMTLGRNLTRRLASSIVWHLSQVPDLQMSTDQFGDQLRATIINLAWMLTPMLGLLLLTAIVVHVGQSGLMFLPEKVSWDLSRINPWTGLQRIFSINNLMRLVFGLFKVAIVGLVAAISLWLKRGQIIHMAGLELAVLSIQLVDLAMWTCLHIAIALVILALIDYAYQKWKFEQDLRMTDQELREELKTLQGDPQIAARRRVVQRQLVMQRMGNAVPTADVVVTNPTELAIAIRYDYETMPAPIVVAKGAGLVAQRIRRMALENGVPIVERKELARALYKQVDINQPIPTEQYAAVAEILRYVYELQGKTLPRPNAA